MRIEVLGAYGGDSPECNTTCLRMNDQVALDAGSLSGTLSLEQQLCIEDVILTHAHLDHIGSLPFFIENRFGRAGRPVRIHGSPETIGFLRAHLMNGVIWPDFSQLPTPADAAVRYEEFAAQEPVCLDGLQFTPFPVDHTIPTHGFLITDADSAVLWSSDTGPTELLWEIANRTANLAALFIEVSFDNALQQVADDSLHLTPRTLARELTKLKRRVPILVHHVKPPCQGKVAEEIQELGNPDIAFVEQGRVYRF